MSYTWLNFKLKPRPFFCLANFISLYWTLPSSWWSLIFLLLKSSIFLLHADIRLGMRLWVSFGMSICVCVVPANGVSSMHWLLLWSTWHTPTVSLTGPDRSASCRSRRGKHFKMGLKLWWVGRSLLASPWDPYISQMNYAQGQKLCILCTCITGISIFLSPHSCYGQWGQVCTSVYGRL